MSTRLEARVVSRERRKRIVVFIMAAHILRMSDADTNKFLELYQDEPVLWDPTKENYKKRESRTASARRIATAMEIDGFTETHVIMKFKNLRSSYLQEIKKIRQSMKSGCSSDEIYTPKVRWFKIMDSFLKPHVNAREPPPNLENTASANEKPASPEDNAIASQELNQGQSTSKNTHCQSCSLKRKLQPTTATMATKPRKKKLCSTPAGNDVNFAIQKLDEFLKEDCFDHFGKYIASLLRNLPQDQSSQLQIAIVSMILKPATPSRQSRQYLQYSNFTTNSTTNSDTN